MEIQYWVNKTQLLRSKKRALIAYHNIEFIEVAVNETMFSQTNNKTKDPFKNHIWILQLLNLHTARDRDNSFDVLNIGSWILPPVRNTSYSDI